MASSEKTALETWLESLGLGRYAGVLAENDVDLEILPQLSDQDLKELGFSLGHRRKLLAALAAPSAAAPPEPQPQETREVPRDGKREVERRQLTVMFCDLVGSTALSERLDPEELSGVMQRYHDAVAGAVGAYDGHVAKLLGDGVLAYFGWPQAHEDDAERAIHAALAAVAEVGKIQVGGTGGAGAPLAARAGIATGPVVIGDMAGERASERDAVVGATPNLAARLQGLAAPGQVIIHLATRRLIGDAFDLAAAGEHRLKGFAEPMKAWQVIGAARTDSRFDARHGAGLTAFVGRSQELALLMDRRLPARAGEGQVVLLSGEAGIGKSRILREFTAKLEGETWRLLRYQCSPHEVNAAFHPIIAEIEATAGFLPDDPAERRLDRLERHLADVFGSRDDAVPLFAALLALALERYPPIDPNPQRRKQRTLSLLAERLAALAREQPLAMLIEDIHWIDPSSLEALDLLVARLQDLPVLAVMTYRPEFVPQWSAHGHVTQHSLNRLGRGDGRAIAERVAAGKTLPEAVLTHIVQHTDGVPLFVEELTKTVLEAGFLKEEADRYVLVGALPALTIPTTLHDSLMARLDRLAPVKRVVQAAACIGREFDAERLAAAVEMGEEELQDALGRLVEAQLIFRTGRIEDQRFIFKHALVQDAAYGSLLMSSRRQLHARLARALEESADPDPLEMARHFAGAGVNDRAAALYLQAGRRALAASALPEAIGALELGLAAVAAMAASAEGTAMALDMRVALGAARMANFGWAHPSVADALEPAFPPAEAARDLEAMGSILWGLWVHYQTRTDFPRAHAWLAQLEAVAQANPASDLPLVYDMSAGCQYFWEADYGPAIAHTDHLKAGYDASRHSRITALTNHDPLVFSQHWAGSLAEWIRGHPERSLERLEEALDLARRIAHPFNLVFALTAGSTALLYLDETDRLLAHCAEAERVAGAEALGPFSEHVNIMQWRGGTYVQRGDFERGYALAKKGNDFWTASGGRVCTAMFRSWLVRGLEGLGRTEDARKVNRDNIAHCRKTGDRYMEPECLRLAGELTLKAEPGDDEAGERLFKEAIAVARAHGAKSWELRAATSLAGLYRGRGRPREAAAAVEPVLERFSEGHDTADLRQARALLAGLG